MRYFGKYERFEIPRDANMGRILSADNSVGDIYDIDLKLDNGEYTGWLVNRFGQTIGFFDHEFSQRLALYAAQEMIEKAILSFIAYTAEEESGYYWGEMAVVCFPAHESAVFDRFIKNISSRIADDVRPQIDFSDDVAEKVIDSDGEWIPSQSITLPGQSKEWAYIKRNRSMTEKLTEQGRAGNIGCYIASWAVILLFIAAIVVGILALLGIF